MYPYGLIITKKYKLVSEDIKYGKCKLIKVLNQTGK